MTVLAEVVLFKTTNPASDPASVSATLFQLMPSVVYSNCMFASPWVVEYQSKLTLMLLKPTVLAAKTAPWVPIGARLDQPFAAPLAPACARTRQVWVVSATPFAPVSEALPSTTSSVVTPTLGVG